MGHIMDSIMQSLGLNVVLQLAFYISSNYIFYDIYFYNYIFIVFTFIILH